MCEESSVAALIVHTNCTFFSPIIPIVGGNSFAFHHVAQTETPTTTVSLIASNQKRIDRSHWICDYADDIFNTLRDTELKRRLVYFRSQQCGYRPMLLRLLKIASEKHNLSRTTLHLSIYLLDCFMDNYTIRADKLNLTAITCLVVAAKIEEADMDMPKFLELNKLVGEVYTLYEYKNVEFKLLGTFHFDLIRPTAATFAEFFVNGFITLDDYHTYLRNWHSGALNYQPHLSVEQQALLPLYTSYEEMVNYLSKLLFELVDISLNYMKFANARPSIIAAACIAAVRRLQSVAPTWTLYLIKMTDCTEDVIAPFVEAMIALHKLHIIKERTQLQLTASSGKALCDSPDSGIVSADTKSESSDADDNSEDEEQVEDDDEVDEDDAYHCLEYPLLAKRRRLF